jgi:hypothetical protein
MQLDTRLLIQGMLISAHIYGSEVACNSISRLRSSTSERALEQLALLSISRLAKFAWTVDKDEQRATKIQDEVSGTSLLPYSISQRAWEELEEDAKRGGGEIRDERGRQGE